MGRVRVKQSPTPHVEMAHQYALDVVGGRVPACKWTKAACQRQLDDLAREHEDPSWSYRFDPAAAERVCTFISLLRHVKGKLSGQRITLHPSQTFGLVCVFGWMRKADGLRRFRTVYEEVPRKNAKTTKLAGVGLYMLTADEEWGADVYSGATTRDQARIVFDIAQKMARMDGEFRARFGIEALTHSLLVRDSASKFVPLSADASSLDGLNVHCALIDELHAHKTRSVHDVLDSGAGARAQPLIWKITTAGSNRAGVCYDQRSYATKILNTILRRHHGLGYRVEGDATEDDAFFAIIYTIDEGDDPFDEMSWRKANPLYGISVNVDDLRRMATVARAQSAALSEFLTKRLDVWVNADSSWMNMMAWDACTDSSLREEQFAGMPCVLALDAAFKKDLFAKVKIFRRGNDLYVFGRYYMPHALCDRKGFEQVAGWVRDGWIRTTHGDVLDIEAVREELLGSEKMRELGKSSECLLGDCPGDIPRFEITEAAYDPAQLTQFSGELAQAGMQMVEMRPLVLNFSPAMKELDELVTAKRLHHNGDPVLAWAISNVVCHRDAKDNIYPRKARADDKIDPAIALIMGIARTLNKPADDQPAPDIL